jgi:hypothetical protein
MREDSGEDKLSQDLDTSPTVRSGSICGFLGATMVRILRLAFSVRNR